jgi:hypothetical protein
MTVGTERIRRVWRHIINATHLAVEHALSRMARVMPHF